ncbi:TRAP-type transport system [Magnetospirillum fulvum MGU-K5]|uniref:TRAP-type transport system n=2 Tax=Magnetospirillum fulvum TaxID=1082 RepID=S9S3Z6_MAGFU|nr:TRAP-type transport system [Magnetospirillum fulvum MGU-K5]
MVLERPFAMTDDPEDGEGAWTPPNARTDNPAMRNRTKILLLTVATVLLTALVVGIVGYWYAQPTAITIAVGPEDSPEHRFARRLSEALAQNHASVALSIEVCDTQAQALLRFARHDAELAILRTDERRIPASTRALAVLEHEAILVIGVRKTRIDTLADLEGHKVTVLGRDARNEAFLRRLLEQYKVDFKRIDLRTVPSDTKLETLLSGTNDLVVLFEPLSRLESASEFGSLANSVRGVSVHAIGDAKALERKVPGLYAETIEPGLLSGSPRIPEEEIETVALHKILVARAKLPDWQVVELMRALFESGRQLGIEKTFGTRIEPPDTEKGALIASHEGASQYVEREVETVFERYSDLIYLSMSTMSVIGSAAIALYSTVFRRRPVQVEDRLGALVALCQRARTATAIAQCEAIEGELDALIHDVLQGIADGTISPRGIDAFRLGCETCRSILVATRTQLA